MDPTVHAWVILFAVLIASTLAVAMYRRYHKKITDPRLHVVSCLRAAPVPRAGKYLPVVCVTPNGSIFRGEEFVGQMQNGDSVFVTSAASLYRLEDGRMTFRRDFNKEVHVRIDSDSGDRYMLLGGKWRLLHLYQGHGSWEYLQIGLRTSFGQVSA